MAPLVDRLGVALGREADPKSEPTQTNQLMTLPTLASQGPKMHVASVWLNLGDCLSESSIFGSLVQLSKNGGFA